MGWVLMSERELGRIGALSRLVVRCASMLAARGSERDASPALGVGATGRRTTSLAAGTPRP